MANKYIKNPIGRPKTFDNDDVLKLAMYYFWENGYEKSSLDDLLLAMGIKKSSFYRTFKSKEEVFSLSIRLYRQEAFKLLNQLKDEIGAKETLIFFIKESIEQLKNSGKIKGCLLLNSGKECYLKYDKLSEQIHMELEDFTQFISELIDEAKAKGDISNKIDSKKLAIRFLTLYSGIITILQASSNISMVDDLLMYVEDLLG